MHSVVTSTGSKGIVLVPESHHYCFEKAMDVLGLGRRALVRVRVNTSFQMDVPDLEAQLDKIEAAGDHVVAVVAVVGSTEEGAVDPVDQIAVLRARREVAGRGSFWLHGDAAYGGYLRTVVTPSRMGLGVPATAVRLNGKVTQLSLHLPEGSTCAALERLGECDSITVDPHKLGYIPYPAGAVCFKSNLVKPVARQEAPYLEEPSSDVQGERSSQGIGLYILEGSKPGAAAASVWLSHSLIPLDRSGHGQLVQETIRNACELHALLEAVPAHTGRRAVRAVCPCIPGSNIVCYAFRPEAEGASLREINELNRRVYARFNLKPGERVYNQSFFISRTHFSASRYSPDCVAGFLKDLGVSAAEYEREGVFVLRSVLMNPWYGQAKERGRYFLSELAAGLYAAAEEELRGLLPGEERSPLRPPQSPPGSRSA
jgi:glutamate/tyrosine decarboxylase-like PLP-dependent enzyme